MEEITDFLKPRLLHHAAKFRIHGGDQKQFRGRRWREIWKEMKRLGYVAGPMVAVTLSFYFVQVISLMMVGHLSQLSLSSTALAFSLTSVTGFSMLLGMSSGLETISGQSYGAKQYEKIGTQTYTAIVSLVVVSIPLSVLWVFMGKVLELIGQDPEISHEAGKFTMWLIPALFGYAVLQPLIRYFQVQSLILPVLLISCITICFHIPVCWALVFKSRLENLGGAVAMDLSMWLNVVILILYMKCSEACRRTRAPFSMKVFEGMKGFFRFAVPSAVMICVEWWSYELLTLLSGLLPNPKLETSVLSVNLNTVSTLYAIPFGLASAASTRISNELGAGRPQGARLCVTALMILSGVNALIISVSLFASRNVFGYIFSSEKEVIHYVADFAPLVCVCIITDNIQGTLSGVARGCGWQHIGSYINLAAFYLFGIPIGAALAFWFKLRGKGLWIGIITGATLQSVLLAIFTVFTNWEKQADKAREMLFEEESLELNGDSLSPKSDEGMPLATFL